MALTQASSNLFVEVKPIIDSLRDVERELGASSVTTGPVSAWVLSESRRSLGDDHQLLDMFIVHVIINVWFRRPVLVNEQKKIEALIQYQE